MQRENFFIIYHPPNINTCEEREDGMEKAEKKVIELIGASKDREMAIRVALALLETLQKEPGKKPEFLRASSGEAL